MITRKQTVKKYKVTAGVLDYGVPFPIYERGDVLVVWSDDAEGLKEHTLGLGSDYSVTINSAGNGGMVTLQSGRVPVGATLAVVSNIPETQELDLSHTAEVDTASTEKELDRQVQMIQQISDTLARCIKVGVTSGLTPEQLLEAIFKAYRDILDSLAHTGSITGAIPVVATGSTEPRPLKDRFADIINVKDFGAKGDGMTDDTAAFKRALSKRNTVIVPEGIYRITDTLDFDYSDIIGSGYNSVLVADITDASKPLFKIGAAVIIKNIYAKYNETLVTGSEQEAERVVFRLSGGSQGYSLQRGAVIGPLFVGTCGTAFYNGKADEAVFSATFFSIEIRDFTYRGFDFRTTTRTGNVYQNIYMSAIGRSPECGFALVGEESECTITQLNVEAAAFIRAPILLEGVRALSASSIHLEEVDLLNENTGYLEISASSGIINALTVYWSGLSANNTSVLLVGNSIYYSDENHYNPRTLRGLAISTLHVRGLCDISKNFLPNYSDDRFGLYTVEGFNFIRATKDSLPYAYVVTIGNYAWNFNKNYPDSAIYETFPVSGVVVSVQTSNDVDNTVLQLCDAFSIGRVGGMAQITDTKPQLKSYSARTWEPSLGWQGVSAGLSLPSSDDDTVGVVIKNGWHHSFFTNALAPAWDNAISLGLASARYSQLYAASGTIQTSDERYKTDVADIPEAVFHAWENVSFNQYRFTEAVKNKNTAARLHIGVIAQRIKEAFEAEGLDPFRYGLLCLDKMDACEAVVSKEGELVKPAVEAGERYSVRYDEALALECAYQRRRAERMEARLDVLEAKVGIV